MGLDPENPDYEVGEDNPTCHAGLFAGETPKYVEVRIEGITKCPAMPGEPPNGAFLLVQRAGGTIWRFSTVDYVIAWELTAVLSGLIAVTFAGGFARSWFFHQLGALCQTTFTNQLVCGGAFVRGKDGTAEIFWGPSIHT